MRDTKRLLSICPLLAVIMVASDAEARSDGIPADCTGCHGSGATVDLQITPSDFEPGQTVDVRVSIQGQGAVMGLYLTSSSGRFAIENSSALQQMSSSSSCTGGGSVPLHRSMPPDARLATDSGGCTAPTGRRVPGQRGHAWPSTSYTFESNRAHTEEITRLRRELSGDLGARLEAHVEGYREFERETFQLQETTSSCEESSMESAWRSTGDSGEQDWIWRRAKLYAEMIAFAAACGIGRCFVYGLVDDNDSGMRVTQWEANQKPAAYRGNDAGSALVTHPSGRPSRFTDNGAYVDPGRNSYHFGFWHNAPTTQNHAFVEDYVFRYSLGYLVRQLDLRGVLDSSLILYGTQMSFNHDVRDASYLWIGGAAGRHRGGRVLSFGQSARWPSELRSSTRVTNNQVLTSTCHLLGLPRDNFGDAEFGTGGVPGVLA